MRQGDFLSMPHNEKGRDFAIGDIHGEWDKVIALMDEVNFDPAKDRMFSVGDLVDRGPQSKDVLNWLQQPWFYAVLGNHELITIEAAHNLTLAVQKMHCINGGDWFYELTPRQQQDIATRFMAMPLAIEVQMSDKLCGLVHAEPIGLDWAKMRFSMQHKNTTQNEVNVLLWARDRVRDMDPEPIENIDVVFVGHTPTKVPLWRGNVYYIDQGACFGKQMTMVDMETMEVYQV